MQPIGNACGTHFPARWSFSASNWVKNRQWRRSGHRTWPSSSGLWLKTSDHMVRNSGDHGVGNTPEHQGQENRKQEKPTTAYHEERVHHHRNFDDGKGSQKKFVKNHFQRLWQQKKTQKKLSHQQIHQYIFHAGFSTADKSNVCFQGEALACGCCPHSISKKSVGSIEMPKSTEGKGSNILYQIPLTLAIVSSLIVESGGEPSWVIPQLAVRELVLVSQKSENRIEMIKKHSVFLAWKNYCHWFLWKAFWN